MSIPLGKFKILAYRDFYDVPRLILAMDEKCQYWIFDCSFDEDGDEYLDTYRVYSLSAPEAESVDAIDRFEKWRSQSLAAVVPISALNFDQSKRRCFALE